MSNVYGPNAKWRSGRAKNTFTIRYLQYDKGKLYISGLSNEEFSSTFRVATFPFNDRHSTTGVEFYHGAHGQYETSSPINTFIKYQFNGQEHLLAAYSCTPLITVPLKDLQHGKKVRAKTVAEIGPGSHPIDIRSLKEEGRAYILIANSKRGLIRMLPEDIARQKTTINYPTARAGVKYETLIPGSHIKQLDILKDSYIVLLVRNKSHGFDLKSKSIASL